MPTGDDVPRQRATSPSLQSNHICSCTSRAASTAPPRPAQAVATAAAAAATIINQVTALAEAPAASSGRVR